MIDNIRSFPINQFIDLRHTDMEFIKPCFGVDLGALSGVKVVNHENLVADHYEAIYHI